MGKARKALGSIAGRRKLASFRPLFPHTNDTTINDIAKIYDDILALSRLAGMTFVKIPLIN
jgi:hypothetical protein